MSDVALEKARPSTAARAARREGAAAPVFFRGQRYL